MPFTIERVPAALAEMGVKGIVVILRDFDAATQTLFLELAVHLETDLPEKQCEHIRDLAKIYAGPWTQKAGERFQSLTIIEELHVDVSFGIYVSKEL